MDNSSEALIRLESVSKVFVTDEVETHALSGIHFEVKKGEYLSIAGPMYAFIGLAMSMYFSSQGAAKVLGPVLAQSARLLFIALGGWWLSMHGATAANFFALAAGSMAVLGVLSASSVLLTRWGPKARPGA